MDFFQFFELKKNELKIAIAKWIRKLFLALLEQFIFWRSLPGVDQRKCGANP